MPSRLLPAARLALVLVTVIGIDITPAFARTYSVLYAFQPPPREPSGKLLQLADGYFLGTSRRGGVFNEGTIYLLYRKADNTWATFVIHSFSGPEGRQPVAGIIRGSDGNFYGTATNGGAFNGGTVFRMSASGRVTALHSFNGHDGAEPAELLVEAADGSLWSTTIHGGGSLPEFWHGTVFRITKEGSLTTMHRFNVADGKHPNALVDGGDGFFYGSTRYGGQPFLTNHGGTLFKINLLGMFMTLYAFELPGVPGDLTSAVDGNLYGAGSITGGFMVFRATRTGVVTPVHSFLDPNGGFSGPVGDVVQGPDGALYGGIAYPAPGVMYRLTLGGVLSTLTDLGPPWGDEPSGLTVAGDGTVIATTRRGAVPGPGPGPVDTGDGAAFTLSASGATMLYTFSPPTPLYPTGRLTEGPDGTLYGTSCMGGIYNRGTVFKYRAGVVETIHSFSGVEDGQCPIGGVTFGSDGFLYGTTFFGGRVPFGLPFGGTLFRTATVPGALTTLWFGIAPEPGSNAMSSPVLGSDGNVYVTAPSVFGESIIPPDRGAVLRVSPDGAVTVTAVFDPADGHGSRPVAPLLFASDGQVYGTTSYGEGSGVYRMSAGGALSTVAAMSTDNDFVFRSGLIESAAGNLIGVEAGGAAGLGRVFAVSTQTGNVSTVHQFSTADGHLPIGDLVDAGGGQFVGVTHGSNLIADGQYGTIYRVTAGGAFATLHRFSLFDGANPFSGLLRSADGSLYGTTSSGGLGGGVIFRLTP
jgi:uncharacterized repeat protein (TIGR03803 family)